MLLSVVGFAMSSLKFGDTGEKPQQPTILTITNRSLSSQERSIVLSNGITLAQSIYSKNCTSCEKMDSELRVFVNKYAGFLVMESVAIDEGEGFEKFQLVGSRGDIIPLEDEELTQENLLDLFCELAVVTPRECLLKAYDRGISSPVNNTSPTNATALENTTAPVNNTPA